mgnify:CR=1 FL=1
MKINIIVPAIGVSGGIDVIYKYVDLLQKNGHDVCVYKSLQANNMYRYSSKFKNTVHQVYCTVKTFFEKEKYKHNVDCFVWKISNNSIRDADVTIATAWPTAFEVNKLAEPKGKKFYFIQDYEIWDNAEIGKKSYQLPLNKIVISTWINNCLQRDLKIGPFPIVYNGLDVDIYHSTMQKRDRNGFLFLMLNHKLSKKGVSNGLAVFEAVKEKHPDAKLQMFGMCDGENLPEYVEYFQNPSKEKIIELYSQSDIFIFPSIEEGWGLTPLEAMACGCVVVGTRTGFVLDLGIHRENMMISEPGDVNGMVVNIESVLSNPVLIKKIKEKSIETVKHLDWGKSTDKLVSILCSHIE